MSTKHEALITQARVLFEKESLQYGRMVCGSKTAYRDNYPNRLVVFNSNVVIYPGKTKLGGTLKIWFGDIDITISMKNLVTIAKGLKKDLYILREMDGRFEHEEKHNMKNPVAIIKWKD